MVHGYSMVSPVGCLRFGKGYACNLLPWKLQNSKISIEFEGSEDFNIYQISSKIWEMLLGGDENLSRAEQVPGWVQK